MTLLSEAEDPVIDATRFHAAGRTSDGCTAELNTFTILPRRRPAGKKDARAAIRHSF
jgi:hypothetical protein